MRRQAALLLLLVAVVSGAAREETVADLKARVATASAEDRSDLCVRIAQMQLRAADKLYQDGHAEEAWAAVEDVAAYSEKARDAAIETRKRMKNVEIDVRKMSEKLRDIKRTLAFEDQPAVDQAIRRLEDVRTALLKQMFSDQKGKGK